MRSHLDELIEDGQARCEAPVYLAKRNAIRISGIFRGISWCLEIGPSGKLPELVQRIEVPIEGEDRFERLPSGARATRVIMPAARLWVGALIENLEVAALLYGDIDRRARAPRGRYANPTLRASRRFLRAALWAAYGFVEEQLRKKGGTARHPRIQEAEAALKKARATSSLRSRSEITIAAWLVWRRWPQVWRRAELPKPTSRTFNAKSLERRHLDKSTLDHARNHAVLLKKILDE